MALDVQVVLAGSGRINPWGDFTTGDGKLEHLFPWGLPYYVTTDVACTQ
jgi:hypothetical protein